MNILILFYGHKPPSMHAHCQSTLQCLKAHKKTEPGVLSGIVTKLADQYGIPVQVNRTLYRITEFLEEVSA